MDDVLFTELIHKLPGFPSLRCLRLLHIRWTSLSDILLTSFTAVFRDITQFDLDNATFATTHHLIDVLACLPRLERSTVYAVFLKNRAEPVAQKLPLPREPPHCLRELRLCLPCWDSFDPIISWIGTGPPTIHALKLGILSITSLPAVGNLLRILGSVLRDLELDFPSHITSPASGQSVCCSTHRGRSSTLSPANLNAALRARPRLRRLRFHLHWNNHRGRLRFRWNNSTDEAAEEIRGRVAPEFMARGIVDVLLLQNSARH
ncbi:hypothetical protein GGX14DRAFT_395995 [Mycena pura]|uniref:Uncharacterized protein n=1 Tax=Mycena pura TaxID=153505 RepID=A0AAD6YC34_9AGAR|nr:hypothetical protein GGX14DRAFT_395995 [Mycena pura]